MKWQDYIDNLICQSFPIDGIRLRFGNIGYEHVISPIVKASILIHEELLANNEYRNVFVFPDNKRKKFEFLIGKAFGNILSGRIQSSYDPHSFVEGQKLGYKGCVVKFIKCEVCNFRGKPEEYIVFKLSDGEQRLPLDIAPVFQIVDSKRLSSADAFAKVYSDTQALSSKLAGQKDSDIDSIKKHITHLDSSIVYVSEIKNTVSMFQDMSINGEDLKHYMHIAKLSGDGKIDNIFSGQKKGNPGIVIASDLHTVLNAKDKGLNVQSIIIDDSLSGNIHNQMDALDRVLEFECPISVLSCQESSHENTLFTERGFNEWRWDKETITDSLISCYKQHEVDIKAYNCVNQKVEYSSIDDSIVSIAVKCLYNCKGKLETQSSAALSIFERLFSLCFVALRNIVPNKGEFYTKVFDDCNERLDSERGFISQDIYDDLKKATINLCEALSENNENLKVLEVKKMLSLEMGRRVCIVISEKQDKSVIAEYWTGVWKELSKEGSINVMYAQEYIRTSKFFDLTIVVGWLNYRIMRAVLYHFVTPKVKVLLYPCETSWKTAHVRKWNSIIDKDDSKALAVQALNRGKEPIEFKKKEPPILPAYKKTEFDEMDDIELFLTQKKYERYGNSKSKGSGLEYVNAYPTSFVGDYLAFYREGHDVITVTDIIFHDGNRIATRTPDQLQIGDFVIERSSGQDLIREIADEILVKENKKKLREIAAKWKEPLKIEMVFMSPRELTRKIQEAGCKKGKMTILNWLVNPDIIIPNDKEDLLFIAQALEDEVLLEKANIIFAAGKAIRTAHVRAGKEISERLKDRIPDILKRLQVDDPYNIWDPIEEEVEGIGDITILKVIDIAPKMEVEAVNTNKLINELR